MSEWFEDEAFWEGLYPFLFPEERFRLAEEQVARVLDLAGYRGGAVLDLCCGPGRHTIALARRGLAVTAVDRSKYLLDRARAAAAELGLEVDFVLEDMRRFVRPGAFSLALNLFTSFGYFEEGDEDLQVLANMHESLGPGGALVVDVIGKEVLARRMQGTVSTREPGGALLVERHEVLAGWRRIRNEWIVVRGGAARTYEFEHTIYSGQELAALFARAGFAEVELFGSLDGHDYGPDADRLVVVGRKAGGVTPGA